MNYFAKIFSCILFLFYSGTIKSQLEKSNWHFGPTTKGLYFSPANVVSVTNVSYTPYNTEGCSVLSDPATGTLEFYTDGSKVIDAGNALMPNGSGLNSLSSSAGTGRIVADPLNCKRFYIFHNNSAFEVTGGAGNLYYSVVDMTLPGNGTVAAPKGDVVPGLKNILVATGMDEGMEVVPIQGVHGFWLLLSYNSSSISVYKFTGGSITYQASYPLVSSLTDIRAVVYSGKTNKVAVASCIDFDRTLIMNFNPATGVISSQMIVPGLPAGTNGNYYGNYDLAWSPDGSKLYISKYRQAGSGGKLYQYDLTSGISQLIYNVSTSSINYSGRGLQLGPDGKIYYLYMNSTTNMVNYIGVVNSPDNAGISCNFNPLQISMGSDLGNAHKFPNFLYSGNSIPDINDVAVNLSTPCNSGSDTFLLSVATPLLDQEGDHLSYQVISTASGMPASIIAPGTIQYYNNSPLPLSDTIFVKYCDDYCSGKCSTFKVVVNINNNGSNGQRLPSTLAVCGSASQEINAAGGLTHYVWSTGDTTQAINVTHNGTYSVTAVNSLGCIYSDSVNVTFNPGKDYLSQLPNIFTPNGDGTNDRYKMSDPFNSCVKFRSITIYNRWGLKIFESEDPAFEWDGKINNRDASDGVYFAILESGEDSNIKTETLHITVLR